MTVIDASAFVDAVDGRATVIRRLAGHRLHAPHLLDVEVVSAVRRLVSSGRWGEERAGSALTLLEGAAIERHSHRPLLRVAWALRGSLTSHDAMYVALAAALAVPLVTTDRELARAPGLPCEVELLR